MTRVLTVGRAGLDRNELAEVVSILKGGGLIVYPTDTLYALGCLALLAEAAAHLRAAKRREDGKPLPVVAADEAQARSLWSTWPTSARILADRFWPGPLSLILPASPQVPRGITAGGDSIAVRVPALDLTRRVCAAAGPLVSTSANLSGATPARTCAEAMAGVGATVSLAIDAGPGAPRPSTVVDLTTETPRLVREGAIPWSAIESLLRATAS